MLRRVVGFDLHRGAVAAADRWPLPSVEAVLDGARRVAVLERINDHENLGVLFRSAAALGVDAVLLDPECSDPLYRRCVRVSIGHVLRLPWTRVGSVDAVRRAGFTVFALTPAPDAIPIDLVEWPERTALVFGAEGPGLSDAWLAAADRAGPDPDATGRRLAERRDRGRGRVLRRVGRAGAGQSAGASLVICPSSTSTRRVSEIASRRARSWVTRSSVPA